MPDTSLVERLRAIISRVESQSREPRPRERAIAAESGGAVWLDEVARALGLLRRNTSDGPVFLREQHYPRYHLYGTAQLDDAFADGDVYFLLGQDEVFRAFDPADALFIDTETTGLTHGAGTQAFLIGIGVFSGDEFVTTQFLMPDYSLELPMLKAIREFFGNRRWVVTFNGKAFDIPVLEARFTLNRLRSPFGAMENFDLLHAARRLWKDAFPCSLSSLERFVMGHEREDDVPSALIPSIFFTFLRDRRPAPLLPVLRHNQWDVLAMASLLGHMCKRLTAPVDQRAHAAEIFNLGKLFERAGRLEQSLHFYRETPVRDEQSAMGKKALLRLALVEKRRGNYEEAVRVWRSIISSDRYCVDAYIELAKHAEHRLRDYRAALDACLAALEALKVRSYASGSATARRLLEDLRRRRERLISKLSAKA